MKIEGALKVYRALAAQNDQERVAASLRLLSEHWISNLTQVGMAGVGGAPDWSAGELKVWEAGEGLRQLMQARKWCGAGPLLDLAAEISAGRKFGKGRQTFVFLLGERGGSSYANILGELLADAEVRGHALESLRKAKIGGFVEEARIIAAEAGGWIRQSARRYVEDFSEL